MQHNIAADRPSADPAEECIREMFSRWESLDAEAIAELWEDSSDVTYLVPELDAVLVGRSAIAAHLARTSTRLTSAQVDVPVLACRLLGPDIALGVLAVRWHTTSTDSPEARSTGARITVVVRRRELDWRVVHYMEEAYHFSPGVDHFEFLDDIEAPFH
ncbi:hypothetical protein RHA1_ro10283 (plasmid) [Rhodococcus jostii RHA1]|jgi:uncharacterized protein (TIGR02246 family)|uniref:Uncharacterized protein n=1 Tax=Rhodococcus jostii (strain RHA1) TaxID=101510 RepID=Q0RW62_RHOJR|nr:SgcJ/EcaC family oxidoreductase [Rhodococcus jostii]ABH00474.1 hypothetical protein RHA1_ro10283 [Rhodococcus jostii RHA1]